MMATAADKAFDTCVVVFSAWRDTRAAHAEKATAFARGRTATNRTALAEVSRAFAEASRTLAEARTRFQAAAEAMASEVANAPGQGPAP